MCNAATQNRVILHTSAEPKPYLVHFRFRAPAPGIGTIQFQCLLKKVRKWCGPLRCQCTLAPWLTGSCQHG